MALRPQSHGVTTRGGLPRSQGSTLLLGQIGILADEQDPSILTEVARRLQQRMDEAAVEGGIQLQVQVWLPNHKTCAYTWPVALSVCQPQDGQQHSAHSPRAHGVRESGIHESNIGTSVAAIHVDVFVCWDVVPCQGCVRVVVVTSGGLVVGDQRFGDDYRGAPLRLSLHDLPLEPAMLNAYLLCEQLGESVAVETNTQGLSIFNMAGPDVPAEHSDLVLMETSGSINSLYANDHQGNVGADAEGCNTSLDESFIDANPLDNNAMPKNVDSVEKSEQPSRAPSLMTTQQEHLLLSSIASGIQNTPITPALGVQSHLMACLPLIVTPCAEVASELSAYGVALTKDPLPPEIPQPTQAHSFSLRSWSSALSVTSQSPGSSQATTSSSQVPINATWQARYEHTVAEIFNEHLFPFLFDYGSALCNLPCSQGGSSTVGTQLGTSASDARFSSGVSQSPLGGAPPSVGNGESDQDEMHSRLDQNATMWQAHGGIIVPRTMIGQEWQSSGTAGPLGGNAGDGANIVGNVGGGMDLVNQFVSGQISEGGVVQLWDDFNLFSPVSPVELPPDIIPKLLSHLATRCMWHSLALVLHLRNIQANLISEDDAYAQQTIALLAATRETVVACLSGSTQGPLLVQDVVAASSPTLVNLPLDIPTQSNNDTLDLVSNNNTSREAFGMRNINDTNIWLDSVYDSQGHPAVPAAPFTTPLVDSSPVVATVATEDAVLGPLVVDEHLRLVASGPSALRQRRHVTDTTPTGVDVSSSGDKGSATNTFESPIQDALLGFHRKEQELQYQRLKASWLFMVDCILAWTTLAACGIMTTHFVMTTSVADRHYGPMMLLYGVLVGAAGLALMVLHRWPSAYRELHLPCWAPVMLVVLILIHAAESTS